ncbi:hypothetical protein ACO2Q3_13630 [Caulobacter sp. KR2-114]|uniref:hypothetical protein n=1 Tax=Caulobacter sp. KR2-114 TaxID=3400912 RepID=UPI003C08341C
MSKAAIVLTLILAAGPALAQPAAPAADDAAHNASALTGPLAVGATVRDPSGQTLGRVSRLTTGKDGRTLVMLRKGVDSFAVPEAILHVRGGEVVSSLDRAGIKALGELPER